MMKKFLFLLAAVMAFSSCKKEDRDGKYYVTLLSSIEETYEDGRIIRNYIDYTQYDDDMNEVPLGNDGVYAYMPKIARQTISGDTLQFVTYSFLPKDTLIIHMETRNSAFDSVYVLNSKGLVNKVKRGDEFSNVSELIAFDTYGKRTVYGDYVYETDENRYLSVTKGGRPYAEYEYVTANDTLQVRNMFSFQQSETPGPRHIWASKVFGSGGRYFYKRAVVMEDGVETEYLHDFTMDELGLPSEDRVTKDGEPYLTIRYAYVTVFVNEKQ